MIKLKIKLNNGVEIKKILDDKQIQQAEKNKIFKKIDRYNTKTFNSYCKSNDYIFRNINKDKIIAERLNDLQLYIGFLQTL